MIKTGAIDERTDSHYYKVTIEIDEVKELPNTIGGVTIQMPIELKDLAKSIEAKVKREINNYSTQQFTNKK